MKLSLIRQLWGIEKPWAKVLSDIAALGFDGVEIALPFLDPVDDYVTMLETNNLSIIPMIFTAGDSVDEHIDSFRSQTEAALQFNPVKVNCHDGRDAWTRDESRHYFREVLAIEKDLGVQVAHETHRGRILYNPWITRDLLEEFDALNLCCDYSHWVVVCERLLSDQADILEATAERAIHVHGRVGYIEGPQVPDPRSQHFATELDAHEGWWDAIWQSQKRRGIATSTFTPEFGPPPYMQIDPDTGNPVTDLWEISNWMAHRQQKRFQSTVFS